VVASPSVATTDASSEERIAAGAPTECLGACRLGLGPDDRGRQRRDLDGRERLETDVADVRLGEEPGDDRPVPHRREHGDGRIGEVAGGELEQPERGRVDCVRVVQDQKDRTGARRIADRVGDGGESRAVLRVRQRGARIERCERVVADRRVTARSAQASQDATPRLQSLPGDGVAAPHDRPSGEPGFPGQRLGDGRLAHAGFAQHEQDASVPGGGVGESRPRERERVLASGCARRGAFGHSCPGWRRHRAARWHHTTGRARAASRDACAFVRSAGGR
jgi:hypothetical protein